MTSDGNGLNTTSLKTTFVWGGVNAKLRRCKQAGREKEKERGGANLCTRDTRHHSARVPLRLVQGRRRTCTDRLRVGRDLRTWC